MKPVGLAWRVLLWLLSIAWVPVLIEDFFDRLFHLSQRLRDPSLLLLVIPYLEFITAPLTIVAAVIALYKGAKTVIGLHQRREEPK